MVCNLLTFGAVGTIVITFALLVGWYAVRTAVVIGGATWLITRQWRRIIARAWIPAQLRAALRQTAAVLLFDAAIIIAVGKLGWIHFSPSTIASTLLTFALTFVWYEIWFYLVHRALHETRLYRIHAIHHEAAVPHPLSVLTFSIAERAIMLAGLIGFIALLSYVLPVATVGLTIYGLVNHILAVIGHSNVEVYPRDWLERPIGKVWSTVTHHALHHERERGHYGLFTCVLDDLFGSSFADYPRLQKLAAAGQHLDRLEDGAQPGT